MTLVLLSCAVCAGVPFFLSPEQFDQKEFGDTEKKKGVNYLQREAVRTKNEMDKGKV